MPHEKGHHPGTVWLKTDLQCHSPRDRSWRDEQAGLPGGSEDGEAARKDWTRTFLDAAQAKGLGVVAITDHHDFEMAEYAHEASSDYENVSVFRGIEITGSVANSHWGCEPLD